MSSTESFQESTVYSEQTNHFLSTYFISPTPVNYAVIYLYITKKNNEVTALIDDQLKHKKPISNDFIQDLFSRFISLSQQVEENILMPFEQTVVKTLALVNQQMGNEDKAAVNLEKISTILSKNNTPDSLKNVVQFLFTNINSTKEQHQEISKKLLDTQKEIHSLKIKLESSKQEAIIDSLTGLLNRRGCDEKLKLISITDTHSSLAIDIDHFKKVNDVFGHFIGDKVIQRVAKTIKDSISDQDLAVRYGGEEFVVVMVNKTKAEANKTAEVIRQAIAKLKLMQKETKTYLPPISVSIGIAQSGNVPDWTSLFEQADTALYKAKNSGRNRCICA